MLISYPLIITGQDKDWINNTDSLFTIYRSEHFKLKTIDGHISNDNKEQILIEREIAFKQISDFFRIDPDLEIIIYLFENEQLKYEITGHKGYGWGFNNIIVEVYNDTIKVDPYHELVHVIGYTLSEPPARTSSKTPVQLSQKFGNNPFSKLLGYEGKSINEILLILIQTEEIVSIETLLSYKEIGEANNTIIAYCVSASFVEFLIEQFGNSKFLELYKSLSNPDIVNNELTFQKIYGNEIKQIENEWKKQFKISK